MVPVPAVLCVDIEPDPQVCEVPSAPAWPGADRLLADHAWLREAMGDAAAPLNWFVRCDPQVEVCHGSPDWALARYADRLEVLAAAGDGVGLHPHNWRWGPEGHWTVDNRDAWAEHCAGTALDGFARAFGRPCRIYRHGDRFMSDALARALLASPVAVDLTLEPGAPTVRETVPGVPAIGVTPHVDAAIVRPFRPSPDVFTVPDDGEVGGGAGGLTMVPLTTGAVRGRPAPETAYLWRDPEEFSEQLDLLLLDGRRRHLAFAIRSHMTLPGWSRTNIESNLRTLAARIPGLRWLPAGELPGAVGPDPGGWDPGPLGAMVTALLEHAARADRAEADVDALQRQVDELAARLDVMESTVTWRARRRLLPLLRVLRGTS